MNSTQKPERKLLGYVSNSEFGGHKVPAPLQSLQLRDYAAKNNFIFTLPAGEYSFPGCYLQLEMLVGMLKPGEGLAMCSMFMLPKKRERRQEIIGKIISKKAELHLMLENIVVRSMSDTDRIEQIIYFHDLLKHCPRDIPRELLPKLSLPDTFS
jgi:sporadic carbohydrate cluster protein (TIGR04323 family)